VAGRRFLEWQMPGHRVGAATGRNPDVVRLSTADNSGGLIAMRCVKAKRNPDCSFYVWTRHRRRDPRVRRLERFFTRESYKTCHGLRDRLRALERSGYVTPDECLRFLDDVETLRQEWMQVSAPHMTPRDGADWTPVGHDAFRHVNHGDPDMPEDLDAEQLAFDH